jgi:hypothetical protein
MGPNDLREKTPAEPTTDYQRRTLRPTIRVVEDPRPYFEARRIASLQGGLPENAFTDRVLGGLSSLETIFQGYFPAWQREFLVHPRARETFRWGEDVTETFQSSRELLKVIYLATGIPKEAIRERTALFVTPKKEPIKERDRIIIDADPYREAIILFDFPQESCSGRVDKATGVPLLYRNVDKLPKEEKGFLWRLRPQGVRPLARCNWVVDSIHDVIADCGFNGRFGVGVESQEEAPQVSTAGPTLDGVLSA